MKRTLLLSALLVAAAGYVFLQTTSPAPKLATIMPGGALLYLEAQDFGRLLREWDASKLKTDWLDSENYAVFSRSNLFTKLQDVYSQYGEAAGFLPELKNIVEIAGTNSALALYEIRDVEFLYISRVAEAELIKSQLWAIRDKFEQRQAGGIDFYLRTDRATNRTVAFAFVKGHVILATRDDLVGQALELLAGSAAPNIASDRWYRDATAEAPNPGELRLVMNLESIVKSTYFRSYWIQRNASAVRRHWAGIADVTRSAGDVTERRVFLRAPEAAAAVQATVSGLLALVPPSAGMYKTWAVRESSEAAARIVEKLIAPQPQPSTNWRFAPLAVSPDHHAGSEGDLETRIDEQPLPSGVGISDSIAAVRAMIEKSNAEAVLLAQSTSRGGGTFVETPTLIVLQAAGDWVPDSVRGALAAAAESVWTTSHLGAGWGSGIAGRHTIERLDGLGTLMFAIRGRFLFLSNDAQVLAVALDRSGTAASPLALTYAAGFRHALERDRFERLMAALDFASPAGRTGFGFLRSNAPAFFSGNIASLSRVLAKVGEIHVTEEERGSATLQQIRYQLTP